MPGATQCSSGAVETCGDDGQWSTSVKACEYVCNAQTGACDGECTPGAKTCSGTTPRTCDATGHWQSGAACSSVCNDGECVACSPGATQAQGCGNCGMQTRSCSAAGAWDTWGACAGEGECAPNTTASQTCNYCYSQTRTCSSSCKWSSWGACSGSADCVPGATQNCGSTASHCTQGTQACNGCEWGACTGASCAEFAVATEEGDQSCGPDCFDGTSCLPIVVASCPSGTHRTRCDAPDNYGGHGTCSAAGWVSSSPTDASEYLDIEVSGCDGTQCSVASCYCQGTP